MSTPCEIRCAASCGTLVRQDPNTSRSGRAGSIVLIRLGGNSLSAAGHACASSSRTVYG